MGHQFHRRGRPTWFGRQAHLVFVHGAFADASGFAASIQDLQHAGYPVLAPANPLRGLVNDADSIRTFLSTIAGPIVLVGHSHGGAVITNAATGNPNVTALVYIAAYALDKGENVNDANSLGGGHSDLLANVDFRPIPGVNPAPPPKGDLDAYIRLGSFRAIFAADVPNATAAVMAATNDRRPFVPGRTLRTTRLEHHPLLVPRRWQGQCHPARGRALHGGPCARQDHRDRQLPRRYGQPRAQSPR